MLFLILEAGKFLMCIRNVQSWCVSFWRARKCYDNSELSKNKNTHISVKNMRDLLNANFPFLAAKITSFRNNLTLLIYPFCLQSNIEYVQHKVTVFRDGSGWKWYHLRHLIKETGTEIFSLFCTPPLLSESPLKYTGASLFIDWQFGKQLATEQCIQLQMRLCFYVI